jgi:hypothetical protein
MVCARLDSAFGASRLENDFFGSGEGPAVGVRLSNFPVHVGVGRGWRETWTGHVELQKTRAASCDAALSQENFLIGVVFDR